MFARFTHRLLRKLLKPVVMEMITGDIRIWGDPQRVKIAPSAKMVNTLFNTSSGSINVDEFTFTGHNVSLITGSHDYRNLAAERMSRFPTEGQDIHIGKGVWIGSNAVVLGPCKVGDHSVIAAGAVVLPGTDVPPFTIVGGVPARVIKTIPAPPP